MALVGQVGEYVEGKEDIASYIERVELYFAANYVEKDHEVSTFLSLIGADAYGVLRNLLAPDRPKDKSFEVLKEILTAHYSPKPILVAERFKFHRRSQLESESIAQFVVELKRLALKCEFGVFLEEALRDRLVCGLKNVQIQKKLLTERDLTFQKAFEMAQSMELAIKEDFRNVSSPVDESVNKVGKFNSLKQLPDDRGVCFRCGQRHLPSSCRFKTVQCYKCQKRGHLAKMCSSQKREPPSTSYVEDVSQLVNTNDDALQVHNGDEMVDLGLYTISSKRRGGSGYQVQLWLEGKQVTMEVDTGSAVSIISETEYNNLFKDLPLQPSKLQLRTYSGEQLPLLGELQVLAKYQSQEARLPLIVAKGDRPVLLGRNWLQKLRLDWSNIFKLTQENAVEGIISRYNTLFDRGYGHLKQFKASIKLKDHAQPIFQKARPVPYALKGKVEQELQRLEEDNIIYRVNQSEWAAPVVLVPKKDGSLRVCGDYKTTVNQSADVDQYPLPNAEDLFATLAGGRVFSKIDLSHAYQQVELDEESQKYLTINTHKGLYRYKRLPFGVSSAPAIFQRIMDQLLQGVRFTVCRLDDILISGRSLEEHLEILEEVFRRLQEHGIRLNRAKCIFLQEGLEFLGHWIDVHGIRPLPQKMEAIMETKSPTSVTELKSYLGLLNYYGKFVPDLATILAPLHDLLQKDAAWKWTEECESAFRRSKEQLQVSPLLVHYDLKKPLRLACDASPYGVGAVISHIMENGEERPIAFASRTLTASERNYPQIEKEALSIVFGVKKFHSYLYGRKFKLITDHKPLVTILGPKTGVPTLAAARMQRWSLILAAYQYDIEYRKSGEHANADAMSRLVPLTKEDESETEQFMISYVDELPITAGDLASGTRKDPVLARVYDFTLHGWPQSVEDPLLQPYFSRRDELSADQGCVLWGLRVVIPGMYRDRLLDELHQEHHGICRMKSLARGYLWWPGLDADIAQRVSGCQVCAAVSKLPPKAPLHPWKWPTKPWERIHIDFFEKDRSTFLIVIDAYSKWLEVIPMTSTSSLKTIEVLRSLFARFGLPEEVVSDNGPQLSSEEFAQFLKQNGVKFTRVPPYHPASNGAAERSVQTTKVVLAKQVLDVKTSKLSLQHRLANFLIMYRSTPHTVTGQSPAQLFLGRQIRNCFTLLKPNLSKAVEEQQLKQKQYHDEGRVKCREFKLNDVVLVRNWRRGVERWIPGRITQVKGPRTYLVRCGNQVRFVHIDHLKSTGCKLPIPAAYQGVQLEGLPCEEKSEVQGLLTSGFPVVSQPDPQQVVERTVNESVEDSSIPEGAGSTMETHLETSIGPSSPVFAYQQSRYPQRERKPPQRLICEL